MTQRKHTMNKALLVAALLLAAVGCDTLESHVVIDSTITYQDSYGGYDDDDADAQPWWLDTGPKPKVDVIYTDFQFAEVDVADIADAVTELPLDAKGAFADLLCPAAKGNCALCGLCPSAPICTLQALGKPQLQTYPSECAAICALNAVHWPQEVGAQLWPEACPICALCTPPDLKKTDPQCVSLQNGGKVTVDHACEVGCVANAKLQADGVTPVSVAGACKLPCSDLVATGGGACPGNAQPICAAEDGATYAGICAMAHCDLQGCWPAGEATATTACVPGKLTKACDGACYDPVQDAACAATCNPVCGVKQVWLPSGVLQTVRLSYRNACIAGLDSAVPDPLYVGKGCCDGVPSWIDNPVCASQTVVGKPDVFATFKNPGEFDCLTKGDASWTFQYAGACVCSCNNDAAPVCGADGFTYQNACQAKCFNGATFTYTPGPCP